MTLKNAKSLSTTVRATHAVLLLQSGSLVSHETRCCCRGVNVIAAESCGVTKLRWVRAALWSSCESPKNASNIGVKVSLSLILHPLWKRRYYQSRSRRVNSPQEHRKALRSSYGPRYNRPDYAVREARVSGPGQYIKRIIKHWKPRRLPVSRSFMFIATSSFASLMRLHPAGRARSFTSFVRFSEE